jgi:MFS transporter, DHA2 family, methylenomycin A resistance protein
VAGGLVTQVGWRLIFYVNLPIGALALIVLSRVGESPVRLRPFDWIGQLTSIAALAGLTFAIGEGAALGYGAPLVLAGIGLAVVGAVGFVASQARGRHPMVPLDLFHSRTVAIGLGTAFVTMAAFYGVVFLQSLYFQDQRDQSALATGLLFLPMTGAVAALNPLVARVMQRIGLLPATLIGMAVMAGGLIGLGLLPPAAAVWVVALVMVPVGVGGSFTVPPLTALIMGAIPAERAGTASGVLNTARQMGGSVGVATFGAVLATQSHFITGVRLDVGVTAVLLIILVIAILRVTAERTIPLKGASCTT